MLVFYLQLFSWFLSKKLQKQNILQNPLKLLLVKNIPKKIVCLTYLQ